MKALLLTLLMMFPETCSEPQVCHDVAVVGGGVGGAYTVWKLRKQRLRVGLYEFSDRVGGRYFTHHFSQAPDIPIELGAMRFSPEDHPILYRTVKEVGLTTEVFGPDDYLSEEASFFLRGHHLRNRDFKQNNVPYNLRPNENRGLHEIYRYLTQRTNFSGDFSSLNKELRYMISDDRVKLGDQTIAEFFKKYLSDEAVEVINNVLKFNLYNVSASTVMRFLTDKTTLHDSLTIPGGMQQLPEQLVTQFLSSSMEHSLHLNHQLVSILREAGGNYKLGFLKTVTVNGKTHPTNESITVCSRRIVLAIPTPALLKVNWEVLQRPHILSNLNTVNYHVGSKFYLLYDFPWWTKFFGKSHPYSRSAFLPKCQKLFVQHCRDCCQKFNEGFRRNLISDFPLDMTFDFGVSMETGKAVLLAAYSVHDIWTELQKQGQPITQGHHSVSTEVVQHAHGYLSKLYNVPVHEIPTPRDGFISHWDEYPYGTAFSTSKTNVDKEIVWKTVRKPSEIDDVFIVSGTYYSKRMSDAFSEYCLEAVEDILDSYF